MRKVLLHSAFAVLASLFALAPVAAFAQDGGSGSGSSGSDTRSSDDNTTNTTTSTEQKTETENEAETETHDGADLKERLQVLKEQRKENHDNKLDAVKLKVCENRKDNIANIMKRSTTRADKQVALFDTITTRVKDFYVKKGKTVANYDALVAAVDSAKAQAQADINTLKTQSFDCNADDPKGSIVAFKEALKTVNQDLKNYRTAVKNLIVAVKSVQSTTSSDNEGSQQ